MLKDQLEKPKFNFSPRENKANSINWNEWNQKSLDLAKSQNKLILLSISATWCHWCHVMDETTFSHKPVIDFINQNFIPIRVDTDKRPDINRKYNMGGWPTVAILNHDGVLLTGGTYIPPERFLTHLQGMQNYYTNKRKEFDSKIEKRKNSLKSIYTLKTVSRKFSDEVLEYEYSLTKKAYDNLYGGFGIEPKFPMENLLEFILFYYCRTNDNDSLSMLTKTLKNMLEGGIFDQTDGGFFRYSTTRDWSIPHYEKMLEDNSLLLKIILQSYNVTKNSKLKDNATRIINYIKSELYDNKKGVFYSSQDALEDYYRLPPDKRKKSKKPSVDKTIFTDKNALSIDSFIYSGLVLDDDTYIQMIIKTYDFFKKIFDINNGFYHYYTDKPELLGILADNLNMMNASINLYQTTVDDKYLDMAEKIASIIIRNFFDKEKGGFFEDVVNNGINNNSDNKDIVSNSKVVISLMMLDAIKEKDSYKKIVSKTLQYFSKSYKDYDLFASTYAIALDLFINGPFKIDVVGCNIDKKTIDFYKKVLKVYVPNKVVKYFDVVKDTALLDLKGYSPLKYPAAYVCVRQKCLEPIVDENTIEDKIRKASKSF